LREKQMGVYFVLGCTALQPLFNQVHHLDPLIAIDCSRVLADLLPFLSPIIS
jgi:hypothetical protein